MKHDEVRHYPGLDDRDPDIITALKKIRYDLTDLQGKVSEALRLAAAANLPAPKAHLCAICKLPFKSTAKLAEHVYVSHDGPVPQHYLAIEAKTDDSGEERAA